MINSMLNHVALLKPQLPQLNVELVSWYITKSCFGIELGEGGRGGGGDKVCFVNNFVILAGMVSRGLSCRYQPVPGRYRQV